MRKLNVRRLLLQFVGILALCVPLSAYAGDAATVVFKSGQIVEIENGYRQVIEAMQQLAKGQKDYYIVDLNIGGGSFLLNVAEVVIVCRDDCKSLRVRHQLDPARSK